MEPEFVGFPSLGRLHRDMVITEKADGSNSCILITEDGDFFTQSRKRFITQADDNFGFAKWAHERSPELMELLGPGRHFGEWIGSGIQSGYGLKNGERRFLLFNTPRWRDVNLPNELGVYMVPELFIGEFDTNTIAKVKEELLETGSHIVKGFMQPEGIVIYHTASKALFKDTFHDCNVYGFNGGKSGNFN